MNTFSSMFIGSVHATNIVLYRTAFSFSFFFHETTFYNDDGFHGKRNFVMMKSNDDMTVVIMTETVVMAVANLH